MAAPVVESIETLLDLDVSAHDDGSLKEEIRGLVRMRSRIEAALLVRVTALGARDAYLSDGATDEKAWLAHHTGMERRAAGSIVWLTKRLRYMPVFVSAMADGSITPEHARVMGHAITPRTLEAFMRDESMLVGHARELEVDDFAQVVARWKYLKDQDGPDQGDEKPSEWHVSPMLDGRHRVDGELDLADSAEYLAELDRLYEEIWRADHDESATEQERSRTRSQRYAEAQVEMARRSAAATDEGRSARKPLFIVRVDVDALAGDPTGTAELDDGTAVYQQLLQQWACDCAIGRVVMAGESIPFDLGKVTYTASDGQRRVLQTRDKGCKVPGCKRKAKWCQAHHINPWPNGPTDTNNLVLLCTRHHKQVHRKLIVIVPGEVPGTFTFTRANGTTIEGRASPQRAAA